MTSVLIILLCVKYTRYFTTYFIVTFLKDVLIEMERMAYTVLESDGVINVCAVITNNHSDCPVGFQFEVLLVINATREGMMSVSLQPHIIYLLLINACMTVWKKKMFFNRGSD